jgi:hypothetical protein
VESVSYISDFQKLKRHKTIIYADALSVLNVGKSRAARKVYKLDLYPVPSSYVKVKRLK